jgi:signal transduction histidine kinase
VHDILAHSLSALSLTLGAVEGMLASESLPADNPQLEEARRSVVRAGQLARSGLAETRLAITALREDLRPLPELLDELAGAHGQPVTVTITGTPTALSPDRALTAYRTAQEALTNARKHAPNESVDVHLDYSASGLDLTVTNPLPVSNGERPLAATGAGYGLVGLAERAALANGVLTAGPSGDNWCVHLTIPA